jgi:hypothetical protein
MATSGPGESAAPFPTLRQVVLDSTDARGLAEFYRQLLGFTYLPGDEPPPEGGTEDDFLVLLDRSGARRLAFQQVDALEESTWPAPGTPQQLHLDFSVATAEQLDRQHQRALALGARLLQDRSDEEEEPLRVYADPAGHPFCVFVPPE